MHVVQLCCFIHSFSFYVGFEEPFFYKGPDRKYVRFCRPKSKIKNIMWVLLYNFYGSQKFLLLISFGNHLKI